MTKTDWLGHEIQYQDNGYQYSAICISRIKEVLELKKKQQNKIIPFKNTQKNTNEN